MLISEKIWKNVILFIHQSNQFCGLPFKFNWFSSRTSGQRNDQNVTFWKFKLSINKLRIERLTLIRQFRGCSFGRIYRYAYCTINKYKNMENAIYSWYTSIWKKVRKSFQKKFASWFLLKMNGWIYVFIFWIDSWWYCEYCVIHFISIEFKIKWMKINKINVQNCILNFAFIWTTFLSFFSNNG
jgi:hypothetical protein